MIEVSFPAGFAPAEATFTVLKQTRCPISSDKPARSANAITGTNPAHDTRASSSNRGTARAQPSGNFTISAFFDGLNRNSTLPILPPQKALLRDHHAETLSPRPRIEAKCPTRARSTPSAAPGMDARWVVRPHRLTAGARLLVEAVGYATTVTSCAAAID